jgi:hypothetical protein
MTLRRAAPVEPRWLQSGATPGNAEILAFLRDKPIVPRAYIEHDCGVICMMEVTAAASLQAFCQVRRHTRRILPSTPAYTAYRVGSEVSCGFNSKYALKS